MEAHVDAVYESFNARRKALAAKEADKADEILALEEAIKTLKMDNEK